MKKHWILLLAAGVIYACGDNNVGNRTYDLKTTEDSANYPIHKGNMDTTPTSNNNIYNTDSAAGQGTTYDTAAKRKIPGQSGQPQQ